MIFNIVSILITLVSLWFLLCAFLMSGFGGIFPLWGRLLGVFILLWLVTQRQIKRIISQAIKGEMAKGQLISYAIKRIVFVIVAIIAINLWHYNTQHKYLHKIFNIFFTGTDVKKVKLIRGNYFAWLDYSASLTFSTDQDTLNQIIRDYEIIPREKIIGRYLKNNIMNSPNIVFYYKDIKRSKEECDEYVLAWDKNKKIAYFSAGNSRYTEVIVAKVNIPMGSIITQDMIETKSITWPMRETLSLDPEFNNPIGKIVTQDIAKGQQITIPMVKDK